ncbi:cupin domain-containing protein [Paraburkholderia sp. BCC1884]|uniref:cupin domain-containing protein n=1 Tax=Paraburkholderia sp. BCC1884 TaxID=2562668 RepID=UPI0011840A87|nr:cupin domain-containing protein [Paraburkholderia sp. BCC1884]
MDDAVVESAYFDLDAQPGSGIGLMHLSEADDPHWSGVVELGPGQSWEISQESRYDFYVLFGEVDLGNLCLEVGDFAIRFGAGVVTARSSGARIFVYREKCLQHGERYVSFAKTRVWRDAHAPRMGVADLSKQGHAVSFVAWESGAHTRDHAHPRGEELLVLSGELINGVEHYPAGTWLRLHKHARHELCANASALILLRNGHLANEPTGM